MTNIFDTIPEKVSKQINKVKQPSWTGPMLATLTHDTFSKKGWIFERKLDGERCLSFKKNSEVKLVSRNKKKKNHQYPEIAQALEKQDHDFIVDGEVVAFDGNVSSFSKLQPRMQSKAPDQDVAVYYYIFDIIHLNGYELSKLPLKHRKSLLKKSIDFSSKHLRFTEHRDEKGEDFLKEACKKGWEGLIAKDAESQYSHKRSKSWLKFKCENSQELVICGYTAPQGERDYFGALIVGFYQDGKLKHAGKVGTGYDEETLKMLHDKMKMLKRKTPPFDNEKPDYKDVTWLTPRLVGEFRFTEWTSDNKLRHPSYLGLRDDKDAKDVTKETPHHDKNEG